MTTVYQHVAWLLTIWFFPERVVSLFIAAFYLFIWVPWGYLPVNLHVALLCGYAVFIPPRLPAFRRWVLWRWLRSTIYANVKYYDTYRELRYIGSDPDTTPDWKPTVYALSPHGIFAEGGNIALGVHDLIGETTLVGTSVMLWIPFIKDICGVYGMIPAIADTMVREMTINKRNIMLYPEGMRGILMEGEPPEEHSRRLGFIRCARRAGARIIPIYMENVWEMFPYKWPTKEYTKKNSVFRRLQHWLLSKIGYFPTFVIGGLGGMFPGRLQKTVIVRVGYPVVFDRNDTDEAVFARYQMQMTSLQMESDLHIKSLKRPEKWGADKDDDYETSEEIREAVARERKLRN